MNEKMISYKERNKVAKVVLQALKDIWADITRPRMPDNLMD